MKEKIKVEQESPDKVRVLFLGKSHISPISDNAEDVKKYYEDEGYIVELKE